MSIVTKQIINMKKQANVKYSFNLMKKNYATLREYTKYAPELKLYKNKKYEWQDMIRLNLHIPSHYMALFERSSIPILTGEKLVTYKEILNAVVKYYNKHLKEYEKLIKSGKAENYPPIPV
jgi:hypothetical protein